MFVRTPASLLGSLRFALSNPFNFRAQERLESGPFKDTNSGRSDLDALRALCAAYDRVQKSLVSNILQVRLDLEGNYTFRIPIGTVPNEFSRVNINAPALSSVHKLMVENMTRHGCAQRQADRIFDHFKIQSRGRRNPVTDLNLLRLMSFYLLNEAVCLALAGVARVEEMSLNRFKLRPGSTAQVDMLKNLWFSRAASSGSFASVMLYAKKISESGSAFNREVIGAFVEYFMDKEFWVHWKSISQQGRCLKTVVHMRQVSELIAVLLIAQFKNQVVECGRPELKKLGIELSLVLEVLGRQSRALVTDHFIERNERNEIVLLTDSMILGLRNYIVMFAGEHQEEESLKLMVGGVFFEKETITNRLRSDASYSSRYSVHDGFDRNVLKGVANKADVDLILFDRELVKYYFVQVKHAARGGLAYFEGDAKCLENDLEKGLAQLRSARGLFESGYVQTQLEERGVYAASPENSHFILIHNLESFDYQVTSDGIALYEWSTFRNLLLNCRIVSSNMNRPDIDLCMPRTMPLDNPVSLVEALLNEHPAISGMRDTILLMENVSTSYTVEGVEVTLEALGL